MNAGAEYSCTILKKLVEPSDGAREKRSTTEFLPFSGEWPGLEEGDMWARGWHFHVPRSMADALDIVLTTFSRTETVLDDRGSPVPVRDEQGRPILKNGKMQYKKNTFYEAKWTQGTAFRFSEGMLFYDTFIPPGEKWEVSMWRINKAIRIVEAQPAEPARKDSPRKPGLVRYQMYLPDQERVRLKPAEEMSTSQDGFIHLLITGEKCQ